MAEQGNPRTATPGSLLSQWWTLGSISRDQRTTGRHLKAAWVIINSYMRNYGNGRASIRYISAFTGQARGTVIKACTELVEFGYFEKRVGAGQRATEYTPRWVCVLPVWDTTVDKISVLDGSTPCVLDGQDTNPISVLDGSNESYLQSPAYKPADLISSEPAPAMPPAVGLAPTAAAVREWFEEFWSAYPRKYQRAKAKAAWAAIDPDDDTSAAIVAGARSYAEHCREEGRAAQYVKQASNWLAEECWLEDPAAGFTGQKLGQNVPAFPRPARQPKATKPKPANDNRPAIIRGGVTNMPVGEHLVEIVGHAEGDPWAAQAAVKLTLRQEGAVAPFVHETYFAHPDDEEEDAGRRSLRTLIGATGGSPASDSNPDPVGCWVWAVVSDTVEYRAAMAPTTSAQGAALRNGAAQ